MQPVRRRRLLLCGFTVSCTTLAGERAMHTTAVQIYVCNRHACMPDFEAVNGGGGGAEYFTDCMLQEVVAILLL